MVILTEILNSPNKLMFYEMIKVSATLGLSYDAEFIV